MKKLLAIALLTLSPFTFAKDFNPDLLVGKWQCEARFDYSQGDLAGIEKNTFNFYSNGYYKGSSDIKEKIDRQNFSSKMLYNGQWEIRGDILSYNIEVVTDYKSDNPQIESEYEFEKEFKQDKSFTGLKIVKLTKNTLITELSKKDQIEMKGNSIETCHRIK